MEVLFRASTHGLVEDVDLLIRSHELKKNTLDYALYLAGARGHAHTVRLLLDAGADVNTNCTVYFACVNGYYKTAKVLLEHGADLKQNGEDALCEAVKHGYYRTVKLLLKNGISAFTEDLQRAKTTRMVRLLFKAMSIDKVHEDPDSM